MLTTIVKLFLALLALLAAKALLVKGRSLTAAPSPSQDETYARRLARMIRCATISYKDRHEDAPFARLRQVMKEEFPLVHEACEKYTFGADCWIYKLPGRDSSRNVMLMSHHDVVEAKGEWKYPPFAGEIAEGKIWGRGTVDTKTPLFGEFAALEELLEQGYQPQCNIWIGSSGNEEHCGDGIPLANQWFQEQGITFELILDEGGGVIDPPVGGLSCKKCAMVAIHEKGRHALVFTASAGSAHGGLTAGTRKTPAERMSAFITQVQKGKVFIRRLNPQMKLMLESMAPYASFPLRLVFANLAVFGPLLTRLLPAISGQAGGLLGTSCAFNDVITTEGGNVCTAKTMMRCVDDKDFEKDLEALEALAAKYGITVSRGDQWEYHDPADHTLPGFQLVDRCIAQVFPDVPTIPFILPAGTDARTLTDVCRCVVRFAPIRLSAQQLASVHSEDENIDVSAVNDCVAFYRLILNNFAEREIEQ